LLVVVEVVVGSNGGGGGGGAGGVIYNSAYQLTNAAAITVTVGSGGAGSIGRGSGTNGSNSVFGSLTAIGGGRGKALEEEIVDKLMDLEQALPVVVGVELGGPGP
jgi:hypothetical protein